MEDGAVSGATGTGWGSLRLGASTGNVRMY